MQEDEEAAKLDDSAATAPQGSDEPREPESEPQVVAVSDAPKDAYYAVFIVFILHGAGILLPWNMFINAKDYFENYKLNTSTSRDADYRINFMNYIGLSAQLPNMIMMALNVFFQSTQPTLQSGSDARKLMLVIILEICVCVITIVLAVIDSYTWPSIFFGITIICIVLLNCCSGVYQSSAYGMAALLPMKYSNAIVLGNNVCGTLIALVNIVSKLASASNLQLTAVVYFSAAVLFLICCLVSLILLPRLKFYGHYHAKDVEIPLEQQPGLNDKNSAENADRERSYLLDAGAADRSSADKEQRSLLGGAGAVAVVDEPLPVAVTVSSGSGMCGQIAETAVECCALFCIRSGGPVSGRDVCKRYWSRYWEAFKQCWVHCLSVWSMFFCTLSCFPAILSFVKPVSLLSLSGWFTDIFVFLFFNLFAMVGSIVSTFVQQPAPRWLALCVWPRTLLLIPFFLLCNCFPDRRRPGFPVLVASDTAFIIGVVLFSITSGYLSSLCMMYAPKSVSDPKKHAGLAAMLAAFFLVLGVFSGIVFGTFLTNVIQVA